MGGSGTSAEELYGKDVASNFSTAADIVRFRRWVKASAGQRLHYFSYRSYIAAHVDPFERMVESGHPAWDDGQYFGCIGKVNISEEERIVDLLGSVELAAHYDCIISTENLIDDMQQCLRKYTQRVQDQRLRHELSDKIDQVLTSARWSHHVNAAKHGKCEQYFDDETAKFVWDREGAFASKVGYNKCCGGLA